MDSLQIIAILLILQCLKNVGLSAQTVQKVWTDEEETAAYWRKEAQNELKIALKAEKLNKNVAKNVILLLGDGMGIPTITAGRILKGQMLGGLGEEFKLALDKFPRVGLSRTYSIDKQTPDSAATATAFLCGVKSIDGTLGMSGKVRRAVCETGKGNEVESVLMDSYKAGKSTGIVSTTQLAHATVAAPYAHSVERNWYSDADMPQNAKDEGCNDIAKQFFDQSRKITVALGGGRTYFRSKNISDEAGKGTGRRLDGRDLIQEWLDATPSGETRTYVWNKTHLNNVDIAKTDRLWGMFQPKHLSYEVDRVKDDEPSIAELTEKAIQMLRKNEKGYFLIVEGGRIDHGHHDSSATQALHDMVAFDDAVQKAVEMTSEEDTLIIVTADHSHTMSLGGYGDRGTSIFGFAPQIESELIDKKPVTTILYADGPGYLGNGTYHAVLKDPNALVTRQNLTGVDTASRSYIQQSGVPRSWESHGGDDVPILARGPMSHLFHGVHQQSYIAFVMRYASCVGTETEHCSGNAARDGPVLFLGRELSTTQVVVALYVEFALVLCLALLVMILGMLICRYRSK